MQIARKVLRYSLVLIFLGLFLIPYASEAKHGAPCQTDRDCPANKFCDPDKTCSSCSDALFGCLEAPIPGLSNASHVTPVDIPSLEFFIGKVMNFVTAGIIVIGLISIVIGGYIYMTAGGSAARITQAKVWIFAALFGIALALTAWIILRSLSGQFVGTNANNAMTIWIGA